VVGEIHAPQEPLSKDEIGDELKAEINKINAELES
jgi:hypothetical protein